MSTNLRLLVVDPSIKGFLYSKVVYPWATLNFEQHQEFFQWLYKDVIVYREVDPDSSVWHSTVLQQGEEVTTEVKTDVYGDPYTYSPANLWQKKMSTILEYSYISTWNKLVLGFINSLPPHTLIIWDWH